MNLNDPIVQEDLKIIAQSLKKEARKLAGSSVLITGGNGFLGKYLVGILLYLNQNLLRYHCKIISIDNYITSDGREHLVGNHLKNMRHDVVKPLKIDGNINYIIHAAGIASPVYYKKYPLEAINVAINGTINMLELAKKNKVKAMLFFSSSEIYGDPDKKAVPIKETYNGNVSSIGPRSCYDESKRLGETLCMAYFDVYSVSVKIVRPFNIYGPGMKADDYRVIPTFIDNALKKKSLPVHSNGRQTRAYCYISDAIVGFLKVLLNGKSGQVYNVGNDKTEVTVNSLANTFNKIFDSKLIIKNIDYPKNYPAGEPRRRCPDLTKIFKELGFKPQVDLETGLERSIEWFKRSNS